MIEQVRLVMLVVGMSIGQYNRYKLKEKYKRGYKDMVKE